MLKALGIVTCSELYQQRALLSLLFSEASWHNFLDISLGLGSTRLDKYVLGYFLLRLHFSKFFVVYVTYCTF